MSHPVLPNAPLIEVACELRFHGSLSLVSGWGPLHNELRSDFPRLLVPGAVPGTSPWTQHFQLASHDDQERVLLAINSFAYVTQRYSSFNDFRTKVLGLLAAFDRHCTTGPASRFGLRYTNALPPSFSGAPGAHQLHPSLGLKLDGLKSFAAFVGQPQVAFEVPRDPFTLRIELQPQDGPVANLVVKTDVGNEVRLSGRPGVRLDLDASVAGDVDKSRLADLLDAAHRAVEETFFEMLTPEYYSYLKGQPA